LTAGGATTVECFLQLESQVAAPLAVQLFAPGKT